MPWAGRSTEPAPVMAVYRLHRGVDARDVAHAHALALTHAGAAHATFVISGATPFRRDDCEALLADASSVVRLRVPALAEAFDARGWTLPERIAINTVIQGSAADIIKRAMINVHQRLAREKLQAKLLLQIHDELVFEFPPEERERLESLVVEEMAAAAELTVPLKVDVNVGANWAECE